MFKNLTDFSYKRNFIEALGFYLAYLLLLIILNMLIMELVAVVIGTPMAKRVMLDIMSYVSLIYFIFLSLKIVLAKKLFKNFIATSTVKDSLMITMPLQSIIFYLLYGIFAGLVPISVLTLFDSREDNPPKF